MANFQYTSDLLADSLFRAQEPTDGTSDFAAEALTHLNRAYQQICRGGSEVEPTVKEDWRWLRRSYPGVITMTPPISTGTVTCTQNSTAITFSSAPASTVANYFFRVTTQPDIFRVAAHTGGATAATLDSVYTGPSEAGLPFLLFQLEYNLASDVLRPIAPMRVYRSTPMSLNDYKVHGCDLNAMNEEYPLAWVQAGVPSLFSEVGEITAGVPRVRFSHYGGPDSGTYIRVEYDYLYRPADLTSPGTSEEPVLPRQWRHLLADITVAYLLAGKNDNRAPGSLEIAQRGVIGMAFENRHREGANTDRGMRIRTRTSGGHRGPLRTESGIIIG